MTDAIVDVLSVVSALGSGVIAGVFFTFSVFVMRALDRLPAEQAIAAMQSINTTVLTPLFFLAFFGTAAASGAAALAVLAWSAEGWQWVVAGSLCYLLGGFLVTVAANVPLNKGLGHVDPQSGEAPALWVRYRSRWTAWNHVRTIACLAAAAAFILAML